ncbi:MAG TPA: helix-turn-helix domain-containing protein [Pyrinomonadaceae bacterium]|jgi:hypothetical protein
MTLTGDPPEKESDSATPGDADERARLHVERVNSLVAGKRYAEAERLAARLVEVLEQGGAAAPLAEALTLRGVVCARRGDFAGSVAALRRAALLAEEAGANVRAALALLTLVEEHGATTRLPCSEVYEAYVRADELLAETCDAAALARLRGCAPVVMRRLAGPLFGEPGFSFPAAVHEFEAGLIERALEATGGCVTHAARLLGLTHQSLGAILNARHRTLADKRTPVRKRLRNIVKDSSD